MGEVVRRSGRRRHRPRHKKVSRESGLALGARKTPELEGEQQAGVGGGCLVWAQGSAGHLQVKHQGEPLQVVVVLWLGVVGLPKVLGGRGEVAELDISLGS